MGYFDGLTDGAFKEDDEGNSIFYPFGILGKGRVIPNKDEKEKLRNILKRYYQVFLPLFLLIGIIVGWFWASAVGLATLLPLYFLIFKMTKNYQLATSSLKFSESTRNSARSHKKATLWALFLGSILLAMAGVLMLIMDPESRLIGVSCVLFFGLCSYAIGKMIRLKDN